MAQKCELIRLGSVPPAPYDREAVESSDQYQPTQNTQIELPTGEDDFAEDDLLIEDDLLEQEHKRIRYVPKRNVVLRLPSGVPPAKRKKRIKYLAKIQAMLNDDRLGQYLTPFLDDDFESMNSKQLKRSLDEMMWTLNTTRSHSDMESTIQAGLSGLEMVSGQLGLNADGLTEAVMGEESNLDDIRELSLRTMDFEYKPVEYRLGMNVAGLLSKLHLSNEAKRTVEAARVKERLSKPANINPELLQQVQKLQNGQTE